MNHVSRTYNIRYDMPNEKWQKLALVYEQLPEWKGFCVDGCSAWYGNEDSDDKYLGASVEPSGLLVEGMLPEKEWLRWDEAFRQMASKALGFKVRDAED